ncbi:MAG: phosphoribosylglycinamide formyltransferase [Euryarchaeota archaeon]|jgi:formyltetrahydrofolate-dependent phosphoribosylglycinamide formyltransferase|nr:phosphoribosylglycinamide formyltransferase [Euryarchaeota archaeon]
MSEQYILPRQASTTTPLRLGVLISGSGSGLEALLKHQEMHDCAHETVIVISDKPGVKGLDRAARYGVIGICVPLPSKELFSNSTEQRQSHEESVAELLDEYDVELVVCSGYMRILTDHFLSSRLGRVVNIHPSPWGVDGALFPGAHANRDLLAAGSNIAGASVHFVSLGVDDGPLITSETTKVKSGENEEDLGARVRTEIEQKIYPKAIDAISEGRIISDNERFEIIE